MGQCTSKSSHEKKSNSSQTEQDMSVGEVATKKDQKGKTSSLERPQVQRASQLKGYIDNNTSEDISQLSDLSSSDSKAVQNKARGQPRKLMVQGGRKISDSSNGRNSNPMFTVHDVVKKSGCETFIIDFDLNESKRKPLPPGPQTKFTKAPLSHLSKVP